MFSHFKKLVSIVATFSIATSSIVTAQAAEVKTVTFKSGGRYNGDLAVGCVGGEATGAKESSGSYVYPVVTIPAAATNCTLGRGDADAAPWSGRVVVEPGFSGVLRLNGVMIDNGSSENAGTHPAIEITPTQDKWVTVITSGKNVVRTLAGAGAALGYGVKADAAPENSGLVVTGDGVLKVSADQGAGIGTSADESVAGQLVISGAKIVAHSKTGAAIGTGEKGAITNLVVRNSHLNLASSGGVAVGTGAAGKAASVTLLYNEVNAAAPGTVLGGAGTEYLALANNTLTLSNEAGAVIGGAQTGTIKENSNSFAVQQKGAPVTAAIALFQAKELQVVNQVADPAAYQVAAGPAANQIMIEGMRYTRAGSHGTVTTAPDEDLTFSGQIDVTYPDAPQSFGLLRAQTATAEMTAASNPSVFDLTAVTDLPGKFKLQPTEKDAKYALKLLGTDELVLPDQDGNYSFAEIKAGETIVAYQLASDGKTAGPVLAHFTQLPSTKGLPVVVPSNTDAVTAGEPEMENEKLWTFLMGAGVFLLVLWVFGTSFMNAIHNP